MEPPTSRVITITAMAGTMGTMMTSSTAAIGELEN
jgi:hypothetical protein